MVPHITCSMPNPGPNASSLERIRSGVGALRIASRCSVTMSSRITHSGFGLAMTAIYCCCRSICNFLMLFKGRLPRFPGEERGRLTETGVPATGVGEGAMRPLPVGEMLSSTNLDGMLLPNRRKSPKRAARRGGRVVEGAPLLREYTGDGIVGSNPILSAIFRLRQSRFAHSAAEAVFPIAERVRPGAGPCFPRPLRKFLQAF